MTRRLDIALTPGLPDDGAPGQWLGRDASGAVYVLRWMPEKSCWGALGWRGGHPRLWPELVLLTEERRGYILGHVEGPAITPPPLRAPGFIAAAVEDLAREDRAEPAPAWPALAIFAPALLVLALVLLLATIWPKANCEPQPGRGAAGLFTCGSAK